MPTSPSSAVKHARAQDNAFAPLAWHHLQLGVPAAWEVIGFKKNPEEGQLVLSDRHGEALQVFWKRLDEPPALMHRLVDLVQANTQGEVKEAEVRRHIDTVAGWKVYDPKTDTRPHMAVRFEEADRILLALIFAPHPHTDTSRLRRVLRSFKPNRGEERLWSAFGVAVRMPASMPLVEVEVFPCLQRLRFENSKDESITVHRYGMLALILSEDDMATFFARHKGKTLLRRSGTFKRHSIHEGVNLTYTTRGSGKSTFGTLLARTWHGRVWIWRRDDQQRLYCVDHHARKKNLMDGLDERVLSG